MASRPYLKNHLFSVARLKSKHALPYSPVWLDLVKFRKFGKLWNFLDNF